MSVKDNVTVRNKKYKLVPPDGGFGYVICLSVIINLSTTSTFGGCFGIIFDDFIKEIGMSSTSVTLVNGTIGLCAAVGGFLTSSLLKLFSKRKLAFIAAVVMDLGVFGTVFAKSQPVFFICQGAMQGLGIGVLYNLSCTVVNDYFLTKRFFAVSFVQTGIAITAMVAPMILKWCLTEYGYRGTLLLITGVSIQNLVAVVLMQPVEWHMKRVEIVDKNEMQLLLVEEKEKEAAKSEAVTVKLTDVKYPTSGDDEKVYNLTLEPNKKSTCMRILESIVDVPVAKKILLSCVSHGPALAFFADVTYTLILPQALYTKGWNQYHVALALSIFGFGDLVTRTLFIFSSKWLLKVGSQEIYIIGLFSACLTRIGMMWTQNTTLIYVYLAIMGGSRCTICVLIPLVLSEVVTEDQFTTAMGVVQVLCGLTNVVLGPAVGAVRDMTKSYSAAFCILISLYAIIVLFWSIELCYKRNKHKRLQREKTLKSNCANKK